MPTTPVTLPDGRKINVNHPEGASHDQIFGYAKKLLDEGKIPSEGPSYGQIGKGLLAEIAIAEGAKYAGAAAGGAYGATLGTAIPIPVVGTVAGTAVGATAGYVIGAISGGVTGSIAAQEIENPEGDINWGRVVSDTILNFIPGAKIAKGGKFTTRVGKAALANAGIGAVAAPTAQLIEGSIEGNLPTKEEFVKSSLYGTVLGGGLGASGESLASSYAKFAGRKQSVLTDAYNRGDKDAKNVVDPLLDATNIGTGKAPEVITESNVKGVPDASNAQKTQVATTTQTYVKSEEILNEFGDGKTLDFGAGRLKGAKAIGADSYEPYPREGVKPTYTKSEDIPSESYEKVISPSVLNVVPRDVRDSIVLEIGRVLKADGHAVITTRTVSDVSGAKFKKPHPSEKNAFIIGKDESKATYQKGFTDSELKDYLQETLGENFDVLPLPKGKDGKKVNGATALIRKKKITTNPDLASLNTQEKIVSQVATNTLAKGDIVENFPKSARGLAGLVKRTISRVAPSVGIGKELDLDLERIRKEADGLEAIAGKIRSSIAKKIKQNPKLKDNIDEFLVGEADLDSSLDDIAADLMKFKDEMAPIQKELAQLIDADFYRALNPQDRERLSSKIRESISEKPYLKREYKMFTDKNFVPSPAQRKKAQEEIADSIIREDPTLSREDAMTQAGEHLQKLESVSARSQRNKEVGYVPQAFQGSLKQQKNVGLQERKYLGEIDDPSEKVFGTLSGTARLRQAGKEDQSILDYVQRAGIGVRVGPGEMVPDNLAKLNLKTSTDSGIYVPVEFEIALEKVRPRVAKQQNDFNKVWDSISGFVKAKNVLGNAPAYATQIISGIGLTLSNGIMPRGRYFKNVGRGVQIVAGDFKALSKIPGIQRVLGDRKAWLDDYQDAVSLGIINQNVEASDIRNAFEGIKPLKKIIEPLGKVYSAADSTYRYALWKSNQDSMSKMFPGLDEQSVKRIAANFTNDTFPNYERVSGAAKFLSRKAAINPYVSFTLETFRNVYNQVKYADQMLKGEFGRNLGIDPSKLTSADQAAMRVEGLKRLGAVIGVVGVSTAAAAGAVNVFKRKDETVLETDKEKQAYQETIANPWDRGKTLVATMNEDGSKSRYADPSYLVSQAIILDAIKAGLSGDPDAVTRYIVDQFGTDGGLVVKPLIDVINNKTSFGYVLENQEDYGVEERAMYLFKELLSPPSLREAQKWEEALKGEGKYDVGDLTKRAFGLRINVVDNKEQAKYNIQESVKNLSGTKRKFYKDSEELQGTDLQAAYQRSNAQAKQSFDKIANHYKNLGTLGFSDKEIYSIMKTGAGVSAGDLLRISTGLGYSPFDAIKIKSTRDLYEELDPEISKDAAIKTIEDPNVRKRLESYQKQLDFIDKKNISISERALMGHTNAEKVQWLLETNASRAEIIDLRNRKIISNNVAGQSLKDAQR